MDSILFANYATIPKCFPEIELDQRVLVSLAFSAEYFLFPSQAKGSTKGCLDPSTNIQKF